MTNLKEKAAGGFIWVALERFGQQIFQFFIFIVLARLLDPESFGAIAILLVIIAISQTIIDSGMAQALIREKTISKEDRSTVFWFNLLLSIVVYLIIYLIAPFLSVFFKIPELESLVRVISISIMFHAIAIIQRAELTQKLDFKKMAFAQIPAVILAGVIAILAAFNNYGVWSLVIQHLALAFISSLILWFQNPGQIAFEFSKLSFEKLFGFGYKLLISGLINTIYQNIYKIIIGKLYPASTLGYYTQAKKMQELASKNLVGIIQKVTYPLLSKLDTDQERLLVGYRYVIKGSSFAIFPIISLLLLLAEPVVILVFGEKWESSVPFLQALCTVGFIYHLHSINLNLLKVLGRSDLFLRLEIIKKVNTTIAIIIGIQFGIWGLIWSQVVSSYIALIINTHYTAKFLKYSILRQLVDVVLIFVLCWPIAVVVFGFNIFWSIDSISELLIVSISAVASYGLYNYLVRNEILGMILISIKDYSSNKTK